MNRIVAAIALAVLANTPSQALLFRGGVGSLPASSLVQLQAIETAGSTQTNVPFSIGIPFASGGITSSQHVVATDGSGALACDETNRYSDLTPAVRGTTLSCIIPSLASNATDNITLTVVSGAPVSGTDISVANINATAYDTVATIVTNAGTTEIAAASTALTSGNTAWVNSTTAAILGTWRSGGGIVTNYILYVPFKNGGTADPKGLYALFDVSCYKGATGAVSGGNPILSCHTDLLTGNGVAQKSAPYASNTNLLAYGITLTGSTCGSNWVKSNPTQTLTITNSSATVTISAANPAVIAGPAVASDSAPFFLTTTGALPSPVVAGTPYFMRGGGASSVFAAGIGGTLISTNGSSQSGVHTIWPSTTATITANSALFTSDSVGQVVSNEAQGGNLYGTITYVTDSTHADLNIFRPDPGVTSLTSGNYSIYGINHPYSARVHFACDWVASSNAKPMRVQNGNLYLGDAWNNGAQTGGPGPYFISSRAIMNYYTAVHPGLGTLTNCPPSTAAGCGSDPGKQGLNPSGYGSTASFSGQAACNIYYGDFVAYQQTSGARGEIYMQPSWNVQGLLKYDSLGYKTIFENADKFISQPVGVISSASGAYPDSSASSYTYYTGGTLLTQLASDAGWLAANSVGYPTTCWSSWPNAAHASNQYQIPYQMTGDWMYLVAHINNMTSLMGSLAVSNNGIGLDEQFLGMHGEGHDERSLVWAYMIQGVGTLLLPDVDKTAVVGWLSKINAQTLLEAQYVSVGGTAHGTWQCGSAFGNTECPGTRISLNTGSCPALATCAPAWPSGPRYIDTAAGGYGFETGYGYGALAQLYEQGMLSAAGLEFYDWYAQGLITGQTDTTDVGSPVSTALVEHLDNSTSNCSWLNVSPDHRTWAYCYRNAFVTVWPDEVGMIARFPSGTATLSGTSGTITVTMPTSGLIGGGTAYYATGLFLTYDGGSCQIASVTNATQFSCVTSATFGTTTYTTTALTNGALDASAQWSIPTPPGGDTTGLEVAYLKANGVPGAGILFGNIQQVGANTIDQYRPVTGSSTARTQINTYTGVYGDGYPIQANGTQWNIAPR